MIWYAISTKAWVLDVTCMRGIRKIPSVLSIPSFGASPFPVRESHAFLK
jgi:hypothetical protein